MVGPLPIDVPVDASAAPGTRLSAGKRAAILDAAERVFLHGGYVGTNVDEIASAAGVSKPTVYRHFGSKEGLFVALVREVVTHAGDGLHDTLATPSSHEDLRAVLRDWGTRQLGIVLQRRLLQYRRLVIGEVQRFPDLARALHASGPQRAIDTITALLADADRRGLIRVSDPATSAWQFNWLLMGGPINDAMLLGDDAVGTEAEHRAHVSRCVDLLLSTSA